VVTKIGGRKTEQKGNGERSRKDQNESKRKERMGLFNGRLFEVDGGCPFQYETPIKPAHLLFNLFLSIILSFLLVVVVDDSGDGDGDVII
jgi:hypothetical protein